MQLAEAVMPVAGLQMVGNPKDIAVPLEQMDHSNKSCKDSMNILCREEVDTQQRNKKLKIMHAKEEEE